ncbi:hypothetical protein SNL152K_9884 [Streptomyces sp. NL15-2K]|nr:hypothetical protein SNL152K_9884 [Streptomyces sp. NL15-2K]
MALLRGQPPGEVHDEAECPEVDGLAGPVAGAPGALSRRPVEAQPTRASAVPGLDHHRGCPEAGLGFT